MFSKLFKECVLKWKAVKLSGILVTCKRLLKLNKIQSRYGSWVERSVNNRVRSRGPSGRADEMWSNSAKFHFKHLCAYSFRMSVIPECRSILSTRASPTNCDASGLRQWGNRLQCQTWSSQPPIGGGISSSPFLKSRHGLSIKRGCILDRAIFQVDPVPVLRGRLVLATGQTSRKCTRINWPYSISCLSQESREIN